MRYRLGWRPDVPDFRDYDSTHDKVRATLLLSKPLTQVTTMRQRPPMIDLRQWDSPIEDQDRLGSCTAHAGVGLMEWFQRRVYSQHLDMSRLFLYKTARRLAGIKGDEGCYLRNTMQAMLMLGVPPEVHWPYEIGDFEKEPDAFVYSLAHKFEAYQYYRLCPSNGKSQLDVLCDFLAAGLPFMFGFTVYSSMTDDAWIPFPKPGDRVEGGHALMAIGYDDAMGRVSGDEGGAFLVRNSWGTGWGHKGYGWLPYRYVVEGLADDFWSMVSTHFINTDIFA